MEPTQFNDFAQAGAAWLAFLPLIIIPLVIWSYIWKGLALWRAARNGSKTWYVALLILNTAGILDIIYYFAIGKPKNTNISQPAEHLPASTA